VTLRQLTKNQVLKHRSRLITFLKQHGDKRITHNAIQWLKTADEAALNTQGTAVLAVLDGNKLVGVLIISRYGLDESFMAVHKQYRNQNIAKNMIDEAISTLGKIYGRVALDNLSSLKACLASGMVAFHLFTGPTEKPTLWLGGGNWSKSDVLNKHTNRFLIE
jgi:GNAT superfamily N-acetyltransferase